MKRRVFLTNTAQLAAGASLAGLTTNALAESLLKPKPRQAGKILNAYYFRAHMYTIVPRHIREDMKWMADKGTNVVTLAVLEQDLYAAIENIDIVCQEAEKEGMAVHIVPSRWGGLFAGAPKVPSRFTATHPETMVLNEDGKPAYTNPSGPVSSVFHPATKAFFLDSFEQLLSRVPVRGIIWDEPKGITETGGDFSPMAVAALGPDAPHEKQVDAGADFIDALGLALKAKRPDLVLSLFIHASTGGYVRKRINGIASVDYVGCDGRPWRKSDTDERNYNRKCLFGNVEDFLANAKAVQKKSVILIENYDMPMKYLELFDKNFPDILAMNPDQLIYYYYPRNIENPEKQMAVVGRHIKRFR